MKKIEKVDLHYCKGGFWGDANERRRFFEDISKQLSFDPLVAENWYSVSDEVILNMKVFLSSPLFSSLLQIHNIYFFISLFSSLFRSLYLFCFQGATSVLAYYGGNFATALLQHFPDIGLDEKRFGKKKQMGKNSSAFYSFPFFFPFFLYLISLLYIYQHLIGRT